MSPPRVFLDHAKTPQIRIIGGLGTLGTNDYIRTARMAALPTLCLNQWNEKPRPVSSRWQLNNPL